MGRLKTLQPRLAGVTPRVARLPRDEGLERQRQVVAPWRAWYHTARWQRLRWSVLVAALFTCARCGRVEGNTAKLVADHVTPHRGDPAAFWDADNLQCLCKRCHDSDKQREENAARAAGRGG